MTTIVRRQDKTKWLLFMLLLLSLLYDQIEVFEILNGYENIEPDIFFEIRESKNTRGHNFTVVMKQSRLNNNNNNIVYFVHYSTTTR